MTASASLSPIGGEGRVRGMVARGMVARGAVCEELRPYARKLRRGQTDAERKVWLLLRDRRLEGLKFRGQHPIGPFIVDFCCIDAKVIVELDGGQHAVSRRADANRTAFLEAQGYRVLRFWNNEALGNPQGMLQRIVEALLRDPHRPSPCPLPGGERESRGPA